MGRLNWSKAVMRQKLAKNSHEPAVEGGYIRDWQGRPIPVQDAIRFAEAQREPPVEPALSRKNERRRRAEAEAALASKPKESSEFAAIVQWAQTRGRLAAYDEIVESLIVNGKLTTEGLPPRLARALEAALVVHLLGRA